jgi:hypothetical protein
MENNMEQKYLYHLLLLIGIFFSITGCHPDRNFYPDQYNPGLSRFTARGYGIVSAYINDSPYVNPYTTGYSFYGPVGIGNTQVALNINHTSTTYDTLEISWEVTPNFSATSYYYGYSYINLYMPIPKSFSESDLLSWRLKRFPEDDTAETVSVGINSNNYSNNTPLLGPGSIYFVRLDPEGTGIAPQPYVFSGLFQGTAGNGAHITKGRFDFSITPSTLNY